jgi:hypothetical protein
MRRGEDLERSRKSASQEPYSPSPGAGSQRRRVSETCPPVYRCTPVLGMEKTTVAAQQREEAKTLDFGVSLVESDESYIQGSQTDLAS